MKLPLSLFVSLLLAMSTASAQTAAPTRVMTLTRTAVLFSGMESQLNEALRSDDRPALAQLLADDFEMREANAPGQPIPRSDWLRLAPPGKDAIVSEMGVHDYGDTAVVSFAMEQPIAGKPHEHSRRMVVDVWRKSAGGWRLAVRYQPSATTSVSTPDIAPDGKG